MTKRRIIVALGFPVLLAAALLAWLLWPAHRITEENLARIVPGITLAEVEELLGAPPGTYDGAAPEEALAVQDWIGSAADDGETSAWVSRHGGVWVTADASGKVVHVTRGYIGTDPWWERPLHWVGLRPRRGVPCIY